MNRSLRMVFLGFFLGVGMIAHASGNQIQNEIGTIGSRASEFLLEGPYGDTVRFPDRSSGQVDLTVLVFWATWNQPSAKELERLQMLWKKWSAHQVQIVAINIENARITAKDLQTIRTWVQANPLPFPVVIDRGLEAFHAYGVIAVPTTIVVDANGVIVFRLPGYPLAGAEELVDAVERVVIETVESSRTEDSLWTSSRRRAVRYTRLGRLLSGKGEAAMAEYTLKQAVDSDKTFLESRLALASLYEQRKEYTQAEDILAQAAVEFTDDCDLLIAQSELSFQQRKYQEAEDFAKGVLEINPDSVEARIFLARVCIVGHAFQEALPYLFQAVDLNPLDFRAFVELGRTQEALGEKIAAFNSYEQAYQILDPTWNP